MDENNLATAKLSQFNFKRPTSPEKQAIIFHPPDAPRDA
jgi:hypothetical protein